MKKTTDMNLALDMVLPEYKKASEMPTPTSLDWKTYSNKDAYNSWILNERTKLYKSIDQNGNVYLIRNPSVIPLNENKKKPLPEKLLQFNINDKSKVL